jgi:hypothetical protein
MGLEIRVSNSDKTDHAWHQVLKISFLGGSLNQKPSGLPVQDSLAVFD